MIGELFSTLSEKDDKPKLIKGPDTEAGTTRFYFLDPKDDLHLVTKGYGTKNSWRPASQQDVQTKKVVDTDTSSSDEKPSGDRRIIAGKDKTLKKGDPTKTEEYTRSLEPSDEEFAKRNKKDSNPVPPPPYKLPKELYSNPRFPKRYLEVVERMMNSKISPRTAKWQHFSDIPGGQGRISAQAGELMTMMGTGMSDDDFDKFSQSLLEYEQALLKDNPELKKPALRIIDKSWVKAASQNRRAILDRLKKSYGDGAKIMGTAWDTEAEVEAMGLGDYGKNKGFSSDMYLKVRTPDGKEVLDEVSLKKSTQVNFLNSGASKFADWDENLDDELKVSNYSARERDILGRGVKKFSKAIQQGLESGDKNFSGLAKTIKTKKVDFQKALTDTLEGNGSRPKSKVLFQALKALVDSGNEEAEKYIGAIKKMHTSYQKKAVNAITENPKLKNGMLEDIRTEFPLKSISDGEETMAIGPYSLDKFTMEKIFGTSDYDKIKEHLVAVSDKGAPFIGYKVKVDDDKVIPIANIDIREDGIGYGGQIRFDMRLHKGFAEVLKEANEQVYDKER